MPGKALFLRFHLMLMVSWEATSPIQPHWELDQQHMDFRRTQTLSPQQEEEIHF